MAIVSGLFAELLVSLVGVEVALVLIVNHRGDVQDPVEEKFVVEGDPVQLGPLLDHFTATTPKPHHT